MPRAYLGNVVFTIAGDEFQEWADARISERNDKVVKEKDMSIMLDPEIA